MADILQTKPQDWKYVSEGGATIVFSYNGPSLAEFNGTVLRLRKASIRKSDSFQEAGADAYEGEPDDPMIEYQTKCMERLIPAQYLPRLQSVHLDKSWLERFVELQNPIRPKDRREKDEIDLDRKKGVLATDLVGGNWLTVEIKVIELPTFIQQFFLTLLPEAKMGHFTITYSFIRGDQGHQNKDLSFLYAFSLESSERRTGTYGILPT